MGTAKSDPLATSFDFTKEDAAKKSPFGRNAHDYFKTHTDQNLTYRVKGKVVEPSFSRFDVTGKIHMEPYSVSRRDREDEDRCAAASVPIEIYTEETPGRVCDLRKGKRTCGSRNGLERSRRGAP